MYQIQYKSKQRNVRQVSEGHNHMLPNGGDCTEEEAVAVLKQVRRSKTSTLDYFLVYVQDVEVPEEEQAWEPTHILVEEGNSSLPIPVMVTCPNASQDNVLTYEEWKTNSSGIDNRFEYKKGYFWENTLIPKPFYGPVYRVDSLFVYIQTRYNVPDYETL